MDRCASYYNITEIMLKEVLATYDNTCDCCFLYAFFSEAFKIQCRNNTVSFLVISTYK